MAYDLAMLGLTAVGIVPGAILATLAVAGVCIRESRDLEANNEATQETAQEIQRQGNQQFSMAMQDGPVDRQN
ncbi:hypothetical protein VC83_05614 [Pseudogymnoascus destructans]|uniref:Uncharacterized protein n=1 Tax=Pseudogymnoascus destructans TaxID=655981 RepID=A0A177A8M6_9PEZI|nr:uncharacterized protein VC83_05614 [Pseudogymnoascus destructans]OAF57611.1 hypothetical protein VC83_05614 [Pseudogymnoascus destructans]